MVDVGRWTLDPDIGRYAPDEHGAKMRTATDISGSDGPVLRVANSGDVAQVESFLAAAGLPLAGVADAIGTFVVAEHLGALVGVAGLEVCCDNGLLRSVAVAPGWQRRGLARALVARVISDAEERKLRALYLLTTTAAQYFPRFGFSETPRESVPADVGSTEEFQSACPSSAVAMVRRIAERQPSSNSGQGQCDTH